MRFLTSVAAVLVTFSSSSAQQQAPFRSGVDLVPLYVTVTDQRGLFLPDLTQERFSIRDNGVEQPIEVFHAGAQPITMAILLDRSPSLYNEAARTRQAVAEFTTRLIPGDRAALGFFSHVVTLDPALTGEPDVMLKHLGDPAPLPAGTALWDALDAGRAALKNEGGRRVVLAITDAADNASRSNVEDVRSAIEKDGMLLYVIAVRGRGGMQTANLETLSRSTGGWYFELKPSDNLAETMQRVADELHRQYVIAFRPRTLDDKTHRLEVRVKLPLTDRRDPVVRARRSYFAGKDAR
jgi:VWFA-related protein